MTSLPHRQLRKCSIHDCTLFFVFTAAQAAQKHCYEKDTIRLHFTAAQAAQKLDAGWDEEMLRFTAAQAAQKQ